MRIIDRSQWIAIALDRVIVVDNHIATQLRITTATHVATMVLVVVLESVVQLHRLGHVLFDTESERALGIEGTHVVVAIGLALNHHCVRE
jgi:hypothetical protein